MRTYKCIGMVLCVVACMLLSALPSHAFADECPAGGAHDYRWVVAIQPTEDADGMNQGECVKCGEVIEVAIPSTGHVWSAWQTVVEPTCTSTGLQRRECTRYPQNPHYEERVLPMLSATGDHDWQETGRVAATCDHEGNVTYTCSICGETTVDVQEAIGHVWGAWHTVREATTQVSGLQDRVCVHDATHRQARELPRLALSDEEQEEQDRPAFASAVDSGKPVRSFSLFADDFWTAGPNAVDVVVVSATLVSVVGVAVFVAIPFAFQLAWVYGRRKKAREAYLETLHEQKEHLC